MLERIVNNIYQLVLEGHANFHGRVFGCKKWGFDLPREPKDPSSIPSFHNKELWPCFWWEDEEIDGVESSSIVCASLTSKLVLFSLLQLRFQRLSLAIYPWILRTPWPEWSNNTKNKFPYSNHLAVSAKGVSFLSLSLSFSHAYTKRK